MSADWPNVHLEEVITQRKEFIFIDDLEVYKRCRVQLHAKGIVLRDLVPGLEIKTKKQQVCRAGEFLVAEIDAKVGGFGVVPDELDGAIVSSHYFLFEIDETKLDRKFLDFFIRTPNFSNQVNAQGSTNYAAIRPNDVLGYQIPLPPLDEQRRIVARIEELAARIEEAQKLRRQAAEEAEALLVVALKNMREKLLRNNHPKDRMGKITQVTSGGTPSREVSSYWDGDIPWIKTGELIDGDIHEAEEHITQAGLDNSSAKLFPINTILIALYGQGQTRGRTGRLMIEATTNQACCAILPTPTILDPRFTQYWLRSLYTEMRETSRDGAQPNWNGKMIKNIMIALPLIEEQRRIVARLDGLQAQVDRLKRYQVRTAEELDALLPAVLERAFRGEL
jgi:type I restriction enzyme S subunit